MRIADQQAQKRRGSRGQPYEYATRGPCGEVEVGRMGGIGRLSVCAVHVRMSGDACDGFWRMSEGAWEALGVGSGRT